MSKSIGATPPPGKGTQNNTPRKEAFFIRKTRLFFG